VGGRIRSAVGPPRLMDDGVCNSIDLVWLSAIQIRFTHVTVDFAFGVEAASNLVRPCPIQLQLTHCHCGLCLDFAFGVETASNLVRPCPIQLRFTHCRCRFCFWCGGSKGFREFTLPAITWHISLYWNNITDVR